MSKQSQLTSFLLVSGLLANPALILADVNGADPRLTGAPGENNCTSCHTGAGLNRGSGSVKISLANGGTTYTPGVKQRIQVHVSDPSQRRWGFELSARSGNGLTQAGTLAAVDSTASVRTSGGIQYATHTQSGTRLGTTGGVTFELDWTPPSTDVGAITFYAAGNAANGNNSTSGDNIYTTSLTIQPATASSTAPTVDAANGVLNAASLQPGIAPSSYITIKGTNLSATTREWAASDFVDGKLPTSLDGVGVTVNGKAAYVAYISPSQINAIAPADVTAGSAEVKVTANGQSSAPVSAQVQPFSPAFFTFDGKFVAGVHAAGGYVGKSGLLAAAPTATSAAKPGETIILYGTGFGPTNPATPVDQLATEVAYLANGVTVTIGGVPAAVSFAGLVPPFADLYQFNIEVPAGVGEGDQEIVASIGGATSPRTTNCCFVTVLRQ